MCKQRAFWSQSNVTLVAAMVVALTAGSFALAQDQSGGGDKPNVIFFLVDDLGWMDLAVQGSKFYETPNIDRLADQGTRFTQAYASYPRCVPSRRAMMTGRYPARDPWHGHLALERVTLAEAFHDAGYTTFFTGKWHLGDDQYDPTHHGFDINVGGGSAGAPISYFYRYNKPNREGMEKRFHRLKRKGKLEKRKIPNLDQGQRGEYLTDRLTREAADFIQSHADGPFFLELAHYAVHTPIQAKSAMVKQYEAKRQRMEYTSPALEEEHTSETKLHQDNAAYAAMIESVDKSMGHIRHALDQAGLMDETIIVFTSDHGGLSTRVQSSGRELATSNRPLRAGKGWLYEGGVRVPLIIKGPDLAKAGRVSDALVEATDFYPTMLELAELPLRPDEHVDGQSFADVLTGDMEHTDKTLHWHSTSNGRSTGDFKGTAIRDGQYKLIDFYARGEVELYNVENDPGEQHNLADQKPAKTNELLKKVRQWREAVSAPGNWDN
jgi:arylsulfatase A-like enzyme